MSKLFFPFFSVLFMLSLASCNKNEESQVTDNNINTNINELIDKNLEKVTIASGLTGTLYKIEGNCMPAIDTISSCKKYPIKRKILIYEYTTQSQVEGSGTNFETVLTRKIAETVSDADGFYEVNLEPGIYSVFVHEKGKYYANLFDGNGGINPVEINNDSVLIKHLPVDYAVY
jgi:hypothetical protein